MRVSVCITGSQLDDVSGAACIRHPKRHGQSLNNVSVLLFCQRQEMVFSKVVQVRGPVQQQHLK